MHAFSAFRAFKNRLLEAREFEVSEPDGRHLYNYRIDDAEFTELENLLREWMARLAGNFGLDSICERLTGFADLFVLYAAEWWRRRFGDARYGEAHWAWEPILRDLGVDSRTWNAAQRGRCVRRGLKSWGLDLTDGAGLRYLGSIAVQGGLPLRLVSEAHGGIGEILGQVLRLADQHEITPADLERWVESLQQRLPVSYRQASVYKLLAGMAWTTIRLKEEGNLSGSVDAIAKLDQRVPDWRKRYPLAIGDAHAQGLIEQLIRDAAGLRPRTTPPCLKVERRLLQTEDNRWSLESGIDLPDTLRTQQIADLFRVDASDFPAQLQLVLDTVGASAREVRLRRMIGHADVYRIERCFWSFDGPAAAQDHHLRLIAPDGRMWQTSARAGEALDEALPWLFVADDGGLRFVRQGGGALSDFEVVVAVPPGWKVGIDGIAKTDVDESLDDPHRNLHTICGTALARNPDGQTYRIRTGEAGARDDEFELSGDRLWLDFLKPTAAYRGVPRLFRVDTEGLSQAVPGNRIEWWTAGSAANPGTEPSGPMVCYYREQGEIRFRSRVVLLPAHASASISFLDARSGEIRLERWGATSARTVEPDLICTPSRNGIDLNISLAATGNADPPEWVELEIAWPHTTETARVRLPFPVRGVRAFDVQGREIRAHTLLAAQSLNGVRIRILGATPDALTQTALEFAGIRHQHRVRPLYPPPGSLRIEARLHDFSADVQHLLAGDDRADARIEVVVRRGTDDAFRFEIARYAGLLEREGARVQLDGATLQGMTPDVIRQLQVFALRLESPGEEATPLACVESQGVATGCWDFAPDTREPGSWLIFPGLDASVAFRPTLWPVDGEVFAESPLTRAIGLAKECERKAALDRVIAAMARDFSDTGWNEFTDLAGQLGHLPLTTLDLWRRFARSAEGMAALALRFGTLPDGFLDRFDQELPFSWETVGYPAWEGAREALRRQCHGTFGTEAGTAVFRSHLKSRFQDLVSQNRTLHFLLGIVTAEVQERADIARLKILGNQGNTQLFEGENSELMRLLRSQANVTWPTDFRDLVEQNRTQPDVAPYLCPRTYDFFRDPVINLPLILAVQAVTGRTMEWFEQPDWLCDLRTHREFDPDWFDAAYNLTVARCVADGRIDLETHQ